jgi:hypothetical protein
MTNTLGGKTEFACCNNLLGKKPGDEKNVPTEIKNLKVKIINTIILPLISKQWDQLYENMFFLDNIKRKLDRYYQMYKLEDLILYKDIICAFERVINEHTQLVDLEKKISTTKGGDFTSIIYKTTMIRLKPEYEIYDAVFGKPKRERNQIYNEDAISFIQKALLKDNISFKKIKDDLLLHYPNM